MTGLALAPETDPSLFKMISGSALQSRIGDIRDPATVDAAVQSSKPEIVLHMAAQALVRRSYREPVATYASNVMGTVHVLDAVRRLSPETRAVVVVTSDKCYENREVQTAYKESDPMGGFDPYSSSKGCTELATASFRKSFFTDSYTRVGSARAGNVIGGGDWSEDRLIPDIMKSCLAKREVVIRNPEAIRPWQHVLEPLSGYLMLAESLCGTNAERCATGWNFGPGEGDVKTVRQILTRVTELWPGIKWREEGSTLHEARYLKLDSSAARSELNWRPRLNVDEAVEWTVEWYRAFESKKDMRHTTLSQIETYTRKGK